MGAMIEIYFLQPGRAKCAAALPHALDADQVAQAAKEPGAKSIVVSSDLGKSSNMTHPDGIEAASRRSRKRSPTPTSTSCCARTREAGWLDG